MTVCGSTVAFSASCCCTCRQAAHARLFSAIIPQKGFSLRRPWCGSCQLSTGRSVTGKTKAVLFGGLGTARPADEFGDLQLLFKEAATAWEILLPA